MILLLLLVLNSQPGHAKHAMHHAPAKVHAKTSCKVYATKGPFKGTKTCK